jgi:hypothetical protein
VPPAAALVHRRYYSKTEAEALLPDAIPRRGLPQPILNLDRCFPMQSVFFCIVIFLDILLFLQEKLLAQ